MNLIENGAIYDGPIIDWKENSVYNCNKQLGQLAFSTYFKKWRLYSFFMFVTSILRHL